MEPQVVRFIFGIAHLELQILPLLFFQLKYEAFRETVRVSLNCPIDELGFGLVHFRQITVNHYLHTPNCKNQIFNLLLGNNQFLAHGLVF